MTQDSTLYSMNNSVESPMGVGSMQTPMAHSMQVDSSLQTSPGIRNVNTPQSKGMPMTQNKFRKGSKRANNMKDMVFIYADMAQSKQLRQEAVASQIRQQHQKSKPHRGIASEIEQTSRLASEMGNKPISGTVIGDETNTEK